MSDLKKDLLACQQKLSDMSHAGRQARNAIEGLALNPSYEVSEKARAALSEEVDTLGKIITRVDAVSNHLRKLTADPKPEPATNGAAK